MGSLIASYLCTDAVLLLLLLLLLLLYTCKQILDRTYLL
jgi:hypothetical protein